MTEEILTPVIPYAELLRRLNDDDVPLDEITPYLIKVPSSDGSIDPAFHPNPSLVTGLETGLEGGLIVNSLNSRYRRKRNKAYRDRINNNWPGLRIVDEGDSWFQYPWRLDDIIDHMMEDHAVYSLSGAGHTLKQMIHQDEVFSAVQAENPHGLMLSMGGNDLFQGGNIANLIEEVQVGQPASTLVGARFDAFLDGIIRDMRRLLLRMHGGFPDLVILIHGYATAFSKMDRWIGKPLRDAGVMPKAAHNKVVQIMLERFNNAQKALAAEPEFDGKVVHVDLRGLGTHEALWYDEIHMDSAPNRAAAQLFAKALRANLPQGGLEGGLASAPTPGTSDAVSKPIEAIAAHARDLMQLDEALLEAELDQRINLIARDAAAADLPSNALLVMEGGLESGILPSVGPAAKRLLRRWERELFDLMCGEDADTEAERNKLREAWGLGNDAIIGALTAWLVCGPLGVPALLAGVLAAILVKRFGGSLADELCQIWGERFGQHV